MSSKILAASANMGTGLWTSICVAFCNIFGRESNHYRMKQNMVLSTANRRLMKQFEKMGPGYKLTDYRVTWSGRLYVTVSALAEECSEEESIKDKPIVKKCPRCGAPVEDDMLFCGECGEKLK